MKNRPLRFVALLSGTGLAFAGCAPVSPQEAGRPGPFAGGGGAAAASDISRSINATTGESLATGASASAAASAVIRVIARHQASQRQLAVARQRAHAAVVRLQTAPARHTKARHKSVPRYIAVDTVKDEHTAPQAQRAVVIWDTQTQEVVGNNVYDIANPPPVGATSRFETYSAEYVGAGL